MKQIPFTNNTFGTLANSITTGSTTINLTPGHGARFPALSAGQWFMGTLTNASGVLEIVKVTARVTDALTVVRAQESTSAFAYSAGDRIEQRLTSSELGEVVSLGNAESFVAGAGTGDAMTALFAFSGQTVLTDGLKVRVRAPGANATTTPTLNVTLGATATGAIGIVKGNNLPMTANDIGGANHVCEFEYSAPLVKWVLKNPDVATQTVGDSSTKTATTAYADRAAAAGATGGNIYLYATIGG